MRVISIEHASQGTGNGHALVVFQKPDPHASFSSLTDLDQRFASDHTGNEGYETDGQKNDD